MGRGSEPPGSGVHDEREDHPDPGGSGFGYPQDRGNHDYDYDYYYYDEDSTSQHYKSGGVGDGVLVPGGGCIAICGWGGRWKRWRGYDDGALDGWLVGPSGGGDNTNRKRGLPPRSCCPRPWFLPLAGGVLEEWFLAQGHHHHCHQITHITQTRNIVRRGLGLEGVYARRLGKALSPTTYRSAYLWGPEAEGVSALRRHTWNHPTEEAEINHPTDPGRRLALGGGSDLMIGGAPSGAQPFQGGWGRQGKGKGSIQLSWSVQGGCTLSRPESGVSILTQVFIPGFYFGSSVYIFWLKCFYAGPA